MSNQRVGPRRGPASTTSVARAVGAAMVVYSFLWGLWPDLHGERFAPVAEVREWFNRPTGTGEDFGPLGIALLLLASGYLSTARDADVTRRLVRAYLPLAAGALLGAVLLALHVEVLPSRTGAVPVPTDVLWDLTLVSHLAPGAAAVLALGWVSTVEVFAALTGALCGLHRHAALVVPAGQLAVVAALIPVTEGFWLSFLPVAVLGQLLGLHHDRRAPAPALAALGVAAWALVAWAEVSSDLVRDWWYPLTACYGALLFALLLRTRGNRVTAWLATRARWLLVGTGTVGWAVLDLAGDAPFAAAAALATAATAGAAELAHRAAGARTPARVSA